MACNLIRNENKEITNVFLDNGQPSILFEFIDKVIENKEASYAIYLEILGKSEAGNLNSSDNFILMNEQGQPDPTINPQIMQMITHAATNPGMYVDKTRQLEHEYRKDLLKESISNFLMAINVETHIVDAIHDKDNNVVDAPAVARLLSRTVEYATDKNATVDNMSEESAHFITELLRADKNPLYDSMYNLIEGYEEFKEIMDPEGFYWKQYSGDMDMLKREAIGKVIARHVLKNDTLLDRRELNENKLSRLQRWWERVKNFLRKLFTGKSGNVSDVKDPFIESAYILLNNRLDDVMASDPNNLVLPDELFYAEKNSKLSPFEQIMQDQKRFEQKEVDVKDNSKWKVLSEDGALKIIRYYNTETGDIIENRMSDAASRKFKKYNKEYYGYNKEEEAKFKVHSKLRTDAGNRVHEVMEHLVNYHSGNSRKSVSEIQSEYTEYGANFKKLNAYAKKLVGDIKKIQADLNKKNGTQDKVKIATELMVINRKTNTGGTLDLVAFFGDGSALIYDYKSKIPRVDKAGARMDTKTGKVILERDLWLNSADMYNLQMGQYKNTLLEQYGVTVVRQSRVLPILLQFKKDKQGMPMNIVQDIQLETDDSPYIKQLPLAKEKTGFKKIDELIELESVRLNLLLNEQKEVKYAERQRIQKQIEASRKIIRDLQVEQSADAVITEANRLTNIVTAGLKVENEMLDTEDINPDYMSNADLNKAYRDLLHFRNFTTVDDIVTLLPKGKRKDALIAALKDVKYKIDTVLIGTNSIKEKMMERLVDATTKEGVKGIDTFNRSIGKVTADWVSRSNQSHPALRYIHKVKSTIEANLVRIEKELAEEIEEHTTALLAWGKANGYPGASVYDLLINPKTMNMYARFNAQYTEDRKKAYEMGGDPKTKAEGLKWLKSTQEVNEELYKKEFKNWKSNQIKLLKESGYNKKKREQKLQQWERRFNPKFEDAWLNPNNPFIRVTKDNNKIAKYLSEDYVRIQQTPVLKNFYEFHSLKTMEFIRLMGIDKRYNFIANVHKDMVEQYLQEDWSLGQMKQSFLDMFQMREHEVSFGMQDLDGNFLRNVPRFHVMDITNANNERDISLKSKELGKSLYLLGKASYMYSYLNEMAPTMLMMETLYTMKDGIKELKEDKKGNIVTDYLGDVIPTLNQTNTDTITEVINNEFFGKQLTTKDATFGPGLSQNKTILALKGYHSIATLGLKGPVAIGALGAGFVGLEIQASKGLYITRENLRFAQKAYFTRDPKLRAIFEYFDMTLEDLSARRGNMLSSTTRMKYMTADRWYELLARADRTLDAIIGVAMAKNYGVHPDTGKLDLLKYLPKDTPSIYDSIEIEENTKFKKSGVGDRYKSHIPGIENKENDNANWVSFKQKSARMGMKVKGAAPKDDSFNSQTKLINRLFIHYRSWLPGIALERFGKLRYDYVMENFDQGTWRSLWGNIGKDAEFNSFGQVIDTETWMHMFAADAFSDLLKIGVDVATFGMTNMYKVKENRARLEFENFLQEQKGNPEFDFETEADKEKAFERFIDLKRANIKGALMELSAVFSLIGLMMMLGGDWDDDGKVDLRQSWSGRKLLGITNRIYRETAVFYDLTEMTGPRASGIPLISLAQQGLNWTSNSMDELRDAFFGENSARDRSGPGRYTWKFVPGLSGIVKASEIYAQDKYSLG